MSDGTLSNDEIQALLAGVDKQDHYFNYVAQKKKVNINLTFKQLRELDAECALEIRNAFTEVLQFIHYQQQEIDDILKDNKRLHKLIGDYQLLD